MTTSSTAMASICNASPATSEALVPSARRATLATCVMAPIVSTHRRRTRCRTTGTVKAGAQADESNQKVDDADELRGAEQRIGLQRHQRDQDRPGERIAGEEDDERARPRVLDIAEQDRGVDAPHFAEDFRMERRRGNQNCSDCRGQTPRSCHPGPCARDPAIRLLR